MTAEDLIIVHIRYYLDNEMWKDEACNLSKEELELITKAIEDKRYYKEIAESYERTIDKLIKAIAKQDLTTGHWIDIDGDNAVCGCCNRLNRIYGKYCKHCGAKMESEEN